jgi:hypothetical protein
MLTGIGPNRVALLVILEGSMVLFFTERIWIDLTAILTILMLSATGCSSRRRPIGI